MEMQEIIKALEQLRNEKKRNFEQTIDLVINLKKFDIKKNSVNLFVNMPHKIKDKRICAFLDKKSEAIDTVTKAEFERYKDKKQAKKIGKSYEFFISKASLMPQVASVFGRVLGPGGKMPSPQLGIITEEDDNKIKALAEKINKIARVKTKEPSIKLLVGKESMKDEEVAENIVAVYNAVAEALPNKKENIKSVLIKLTMSKPVKISLS